jgi:hypothetical protein
LSVEVQASSCCSLPCPPSQSKPPARKPIAVQMYTLRNAGSLEQQLKIVHDAGVHAVETVGTQNVSAAELKQLLDRYSIKAISSHVPLAELRSNLDGVVTFNRSIGNTRWWCRTWTKDRPSDAAGWTALGRNWAASRKQVRGKGMRLAYHNHDFELVDFDGRTGWNCCSPPPARPADRAGPGLGRACGPGPGGDAGKVPRPRIRGARQGQCAQGPGRRRRRIRCGGPGRAGLERDPACRGGAGVQWYIIEHDQPRDPAKVIQTGADYLREHLTTNPPARARR